jgi:sulfate permease, SulP family
MPRVDLAALRRMALQREAFSALTAMLVAVPAAIANGLVLFAPLGPGFAAAGAMAGIVGAAALGTIAPLLGGTPGLVSAPSPAAAAFVALVVSQLLGSGVPPGAVPAYVAVVVCVAGVLQMVIGLVRGGRLVKYLPYPVVAGYLTGAGLLILHLQVGKMLGTPADWSGAQALTSPRAWQGAALAISVTTLVVTLAAPRVIRRVPATLVGLGAGVAVHQLLALRWPELGHPVGNPLLVGRILEGSGAAGPAGALGSLTTVASWDVLRMALVPGATLAVLLSIDTLKTCLLVDMQTQARHDSDRELVGQGMGNTVSALLGGAPGTGIVSASMVNVTSGARTRASGALAGVLALLVLLGLGPAVAWLPVPALAAIVVLMALRMLQRELLALLRDRSTLVEFALAAAVIGVAIAVNLAAAAALGVLLAMVLFLLEHARMPVVRRSIDGRSVAGHGRGERESRFLEEQGGEILLVELQGSLFFGTADRLAAELAPSLDRRRFVIVDLSRVTALDISAVHTLKTVAARLAHRGGRLLLCEAPGGTSGKRLASYLELLELTRPPLSVAVLPHVEDALEWAEERILGVADAIAPLDLHEIDLLQPLPAEAVQALRHVVSERSFGRGERIFSAGDRGRELFLIRSGEVRIEAPLDGERTNVITTLTPGDFFGDLAYLDGSPRSAHAVARADTLLYVLAPEDVARAATHFPALETAIVARTATTIARRLRRASRQIERLRQS